MKICLICKTEQKATHNFPHPEENNFMRADAASFDTCNSCFWELNTEERHYIFKNDHLPDSVFQKKSINAWK